MSIPTIITPMHFSLARDSICQLLANERENQKILARESGASEDWINQSLDFTIFPKRFRFPDVTDMPCVYVYFNKLEFPDNEQDAYENMSYGDLQVEFYTIGENEETETEFIKTADENAEDRLNYLTAQLYKILCSEETNVYKATDKLVNHFVIKSWERILTPENDNTAGTVLGAKFVFECGFSEPTHYANTVKIREFYTKLNIRDEFIDPLTKVILKGE